MIGVNEATVGVVLAGGRSSRMGRDKAMLTWHGDTLLAHMQQCLRLSGVTRVVVSGAYPHCDAVRCPPRGVANLRFVSPGSRDSPRIIDTVLARSGPFRSSGQ